MSESRLQEPFLDEIATSFGNTRDSLVKLLEMAPASQHKGLIDDELQRLFFSLFVLLDGGTTLADKGQLQIVDDEGHAFDPYLHEICLAYWPEPGKDGIGS